MGWSFPQMSSARSGSLGEPFIDDRAAQIARFVRASRFRVRAWGAEHVRGTMAQRSDGGWYRAVAEGQAIYFRLTFLPAIHVLMGTSPQTSP
jgi:hypothetical protein